MTTITLDWDNEEKTILRYTFQGNWNWDDYLQWLSVGRNMMKSVKHEVCIINDMRLMKQLPANFVNTASGIIISRPSNTGLVVFLTTNTFFQVTYRILGRILEEIPTQYILASTEEEAYKKIEAWRNKPQQSSAV